MVTSSPSLVSLSKLSSGMPMFESASISLGVLAAGALNQLDSSLAPMFRHLKPLEATTC